MKNTNRLIFAALAAVALLFAAGCSDSSDDDSISASDLEGTTWTYSEGGSTVTYTFESDGKATWSYSSSGGSGTYSGTYTVSGSTVTVIISYDEDEYPDDEFQFTYSSGKLVAGDMTFTKS